jgi:hypothetical protein
MGDLASKRVKASQDDSWLATLINHSRSQREELRQQPQRSSDSSSGPRSVTNPQSFALAEGGNTPTTTEIERSFIWASKRYQSTIIRAHRGRNYANNHRDRAIHHQGLEALPIDNHSHSRGRKYANNHRDRAIHHQGLEALPIHNPLDGWHKLRRG